MKQMYDKNDINTTSEFDFFGGDADEFQRKVNDIKSICVCGKFSEKEPLITIVIPTYKRVRTLKLALNSALNQQGFDSYEILVVDNEGADIGLETETSRYIKELNHDKVIYFRHEKSVDYKMDHAVNLARTRWIMFLHDDDMLAPNALKVLYNVAKESSQYSWIACTSRQFIDGDEDKVIGFDKNIWEHYRTHIKSYPPQFSCTGYVPGWLGALIDRQKYINMGGTPTRNLGCADFVMQGKYAYRYRNEICSCQTDFPLYYYRLWEGQTSSAGVVEWFNIYINEYLFYVYCAKTYHKYVWKYWAYIGWQNIRRKIHCMNTEYYQLNIDEDKMRNLLDVPHSWSSDGIANKLKYLFFLIYYNYWSIRA